MTVQGTIHNGVVVLPAGTLVAEGATVVVHLTPPPEETKFELPYKMVNGIRVFPAREGLEPITVEFVNRLRDESE